MKMWNTAKPKTQCKTTNVTKLLNLTKPNATQNRKNTTLNKRISEFNSEAKNPKREEEKQRKECSTV